MRFFFKIAILVFFVSVGCTTAPRSQNRLGTKLQAEDLLKAVCSPGQTIQSVQGTIWFKASSKEISGQYAANIVLATPNELKLEITNFLGGTEALISVQDDHYIVTGPNGKNEEKKDEGYETWGGIPLKWATELFLGRIPCPTIGKRERMSVSPEGDLMIQVLNASGNGTQDAEEVEKYVYTFRDFEGKVWPETLRWEKLTTPSIAVDFKFDDPEKGTLSPRKWEARSSRGAIKVRWRERK